MAPLLTGIPASYRSATRTQVAALAEALVCLEASAQCEFFIRADQGGRVDCALSLADNPPTGTPTQRLVTLMEAEDIADVIPLENKDVGLRADDSTNISWSMRISEAQYGCVQLFLVTAVSEPGYVVALPQHYNSRRTSASDPTTQHRSDGFRPRWILHQLPAFPSEWGPFVLPFKGLGRLLTAFRAYAKGETDEFSNEHTGVIFIDMPRPQAFPATVLQPDYIPWKTAAEVVRLAQRAFHEFSTDFAVEFCDIVPMFGDFKITHLDSGEQIFVEVKGLHCTVERNNETGKLSMEHHSISLGFDSRRRVFSWGAQWDFILTTFTFEGKWQAFLVPRDWIPSGWWNGPIPEPYQWPDRYRYELEACLIDLESPETLVHQFQGCLRRLERMTGSMRAMNEIPLPATDGQVDGAEPDVGEEFNGDPDEHMEGIRMERWISSDPLKGLGSYQYELRWPTTVVWASECLIESFRRSGKGLVLDFGRRNRICRYGFISYIWSPSDKNSYDEDKELPRRPWHLDKDIPVVPLSFVMAEWVLGLNPLGVRKRSKDEDGVDEHSAPSLVILDCHTPYCMRFSHGRFVVPSGIFSEGLRGCKCTLQHGEVFENYFFDEHDVPEAIMEMAIDSVDANVGFGGNRYVRTVSEILQQGIEDLDEDLPLD